jgi:hypothetical protein
MMTAAQFTLKYPLSPMNSEQALEKREGEIFVSMIPHVISNSGKVAFAIAQSRNLE